MKTQKTAQETPEPAPVIEALPTPTPEQILADRLKSAETLIATTDAKLRETLELLAGETKALTEERTRSHSLAEMLDESRKAREAEIKQHVAEMQEQHRNYKLLKAELEEVSRLRDNAIEAKDKAEHERDEARAQWEEWSTHPFFGALYQLERQTGELSADLVEHVDRVIAGVNDSGKAGKVTLVLGIKASEEHRGALIAAAKVSSTVPKGDPSRAYFFMDKGRITEDDPAQPPLIKTPRSLKPAATVEEKQLEQKLAKAKPVVEVTEVPEDMIEDYDAALQVVSVDGAKASVSLLQRRMKIGYNRASELFELLKKRGAIQ